MLIYPDIELQIAYSFHEHLNEARNTFNGTSDSKIVSFFVLKPIVRKIQESLVITTQHDNEFFSTA